MSMMMNLSTSELEVAHQKQQQQIKLNPTPLVKKTKTKVKLNDGKRFLNNPYYAGTPLVSRKNHQQQQLMMNLQQQEQEIQGNQQQEQEIQGNQQQQEVEQQPAQPKFFVTPPEQQQQQQQQEPVQPMFTPTSFGYDSFVAADQQQQQHNSGSLNSTQGCPCCGSSSSNNSSNHQSANHSFAHNNSSINDNNNNGYSYSNQQQQQSSYTPQDNFSFTSQQFLAGTSCNNNENLNNSVLSTRSSSFSNHAFQEELEQPVQPQQLQLPAPNSTTIVTASSNNNNNKEFSYPPNTSFVVIMFKHELCTFQCKFFVVEGDWVVVQADRGEHVGRVRSVSQECPAFHVPSHILRHANFAEISSVESNHPHEEGAAQRIQQIVEELQLPNLRVTDTEFYSDGNKMTVFFSSKSTVDFRELQRRAFREFRRRIWLINNAEVQYRNRNCRNRK